MHSLTFPDILHEYYQPNEPIHTFQHKETHIYNKIKETYQKKQIRFVLKEYLILINPRFD